MQAFCEKKFTLQTLFVERSGFCKDFEVGVLNKLLSKPEHASTKYHILGILNIFTCADINTLQTPPLCTVCWLAKTEIYFFAVQPTGLVQKNCHYF